MSRQTLNIGLISPHQQHKSEKPGKPSLKPATASYRQSAKRFYTAWAGSLTDDAIAMALDSGERDFVIAALGLRSGIAHGRVARMVKAESARTVVSLAWKAGLTARFAMDLQRQLVRIPHRKVINARGGVDFALGPKEMTEQLALFD
jgi:hypothetical protein